KVTATASFTFTDAGEPGTKDTASYVITLSNGTVVLDSKGSQLLNKGNHQAHPEIANLLPAAATIAKQISQTFSQLDSPSAIQSDVDARTLDLLAQFAQFEAAQAGAKHNGMAFRDLNHDGVQELGESGLAGLTVQLYSQGGTLVATTTTDSNGFYQFQAAPGTYYVVFQKPTGTSVFSPKYN